MEKRMPMKISAAVFFLFLSVVGELFANDSIVQYDKRQLKCLVDNIYHEARGEGKKGMRLVGDTTINRVLSEEFPDTICSVVHQDGQFSWTRRGRPPVTEPDMYENAKDVAMNVLHRSHDTSNGALFFYGHRLVRPKWSYYKNVTIVYKNHTFLK